MRLTSKNYFSIPANQQFCSVSQLKRFIGSNGQVGCEKRALAEINEEVIRKPSNAMLLGSYVDCMLLEPRKKKAFEAEHPEMFSSRGETKGMLKKEFAIANEMVATAKGDPVFMKALKGKKQKIMKGNIFGVPFKIKLDVLGENKITDLKTCASIYETQYNPVSGKRESFIEYFDYPLQGAIYQEIVRQNTGKKLPFFLACISKEEVPDHEVIWIDDESLEERLQEVMPYIVHVGMLKAGEVEPTGCGVCEYCRAHKKITGAINWRDVGGKLE